MKRCPRCERTLPLAAFNASTRYGVQGYCRDCHAEYRGAWDAARGPRSSTRRVAARRDPRLAYLAELRREAVAVRRAGGVGAAGGEVW